jgi:hypothetical protein
MVLVGSAEVWFRFRADDFRGARGRREVQRGWQTYPLATHCEHGTLRSQRALDMAHLVHAIKAALLIGMAVVIDGAVDVPMTDVG